jgi:hypothetical protein
MQQPDIIGLERCLSVDRRAADLSQPIQSSIVNRQSVNPQSTIGNPQSTRRHPCGPSSPTAHCTPEALARRRDRLMSRLARRCLAQTGLDPSQQLAEQWFAQATAHLLDSFDFVWRTLFQACSFNHSDIIERRCASASQQRLGEKRDFGDRNHIVRGDRQASPRAPHLAGQGVRDPRLQPTEPHSRQALLRARRPAFGARKV